MPDKDRLYAINDALTQLAARFGLNERLDPDELDDRLNEATHAVAVAFFDGEDEE